MAEWSDMAVPVDVDLAAFRSWLYARPPIEVVGYALDQGDCPLSRWLREANAAEGAWVNAGAYGVRWRTPSIATLPMRARSFVRILDGRGGPRPVTASECLAILALI
jgi:hypothetical protein